MGPARRLWRGLAGRTRQYESRFKVRIRLMDQDKAQLDFDDFVRYNKVAFLTTY
jgi:hypothetical protein